MFLRTSPNKSKVMTTLTAREARASLYRLIGQAAQSTFSIIFFTKFFVKKNCSESKNMDSSQIASAMLPIFHEHLTMS
jgi:hypothetical protein